MVSDFDRGLQHGLVIGYKAGYSAARHEAWHRVHDAIDLVDLPDEQIEAKFRSVFYPEPEPLPVEPQVVEVEA